MLQQNRLDKIVEGSVIFIIVIALWSMGMAAAVAHGGLFARGNRNSLEEGEGDGEGAATLRQIERVAFVVFSLVWLVGSVGQLLAIRKHSNRYAKTKTTASHFFVFSFVCPEPFSAGEPGHIFCDVSNDN